MRLYSFYQFEGRSIRTVSGIGKNRRDFIAKAKKAGHTQAYRAKLVSDEILGLISGYKILKLIREPGFFLISEWREIDPLDQILSDL